MSLLSSIRRWLRLPETFTARDFRKREKLRPDYRRVARSLIDSLDFESVYDVGCANGFLLAEFRAAGKRVGGIEVSPAAREVLPRALQPCVEVGDFAEAGGTWDLVCCVEIAEHIPPARSMELVATVDRTARRWVYFTAAPPGQKGHGHINCRPHEQWLGWFAERGWHDDEARTERVRAALGSLEIAVWLRNNSFILGRSPETPRSPG